MQRRHRGGSGRGDSAGSSEAWIVLGSHRRRGFSGNGGGLAACAVGGDSKVVAELAKRPEQLRIFPECASGGDAEGARGSPEDVDVGDGGS